MSHTDKHTLPITETLFHTREDAQAFANLKSLVDGETVTGPYVLGPNFAVYTSAKA